MSDALTKFREHFPEAEVYQHNERRLYLKIPRAKVTPACQFLYGDCGMRLSICTALDTRDGFEVLYHFSEDRTGRIFTLKVLAPKDDPKIESQARWLPAAEWIEREMHELFGIDFPGHPNLAPLLTSDTDWEPGRFPLRRDYERRSEAHER